MEKLSYRGFRASVDYIAGDLVIKVLGVPEILQARCIRPADLWPAMQALVDDYLQRCQSAGLMPDAPRLALAHAI